MLGALLALVSYGPPQLDQEVNPRFQDFYSGEIGPYWPSGRRLVDGGYRDLPFPFPEINLPRLDIRRNWDLAALLGYVSTWSATRRAREAGADAVLTAFSGDLARLWGDPARRRPVVWPVYARIGRLPPPSG